MKHTITPELLEAGKQYIRMTYYKLDQQVPEGLDDDDAVRSLFAAPDSPEKRHFLRFVRNVTKDAGANAAAEAAGLYDIYGLYSALCDVSEHIMHGQGKKQYRTPQVYVTSTEARRSASDIVSVIKQVTGFDLMDPAGSLKRMGRKKVSA